MAPPPPLSDITRQLVFNTDGLIPAVAQQHDTGEVLMLAWMNKQAIEETLTSGRVCYFSRSRKSLWRKGESSGQIQNLVALLVDCDMDSLLLQVDQTGVACHTGRRTCFYQKFDKDGLHTIHDILVDPHKLYSS